MKNNNNVLARVADVVVSLAAARRAPLYFFTDSAEGFYYYHVLLLVVVGRTVQHHHRTSCCLPVVKVGTFDHQHVVVHVPPRQQTIRTPDDSIYYLYTVRKFPLLLGTTFLGFFKLGQYGRSAAGGGRRGAVEVVTTTAVTSMITATMTAMAATLGNPLSSRTKGPVRV